MGIIEKAMTKRTVAPLPGTLGQWFAERAREFPFLTAGELQGLAATRAILGVDTGKTGSSYSTATGRVASTGPDARSLLRAEGRVGPGSVISCGAQHPLQGFVRDWELGMAVTGEGATSLEALGYRTVDGSLVNKDLFTAARDAAAAVLASGIGLHLAEGAPAADMIEVLPVPAGGFLDAVPYPFENDHLDRLPEPFTARLALDAEDVAALQRVVDRSHYPSCAGDASGLRVVPLSGGRPGDCGQVRLASTADGGELVIELPRGLPPVEAQRSFRAALCVVSGLGFQARSERPALNEAITRHLDQVMAPLLAPDRMERWQPRWSKEVPAPSVRLTAGRWLPMGVVVQTATQHNYFSLAVAAQNWVSLAKRTWAHGLRKKTRDGTRQFLARRPGILVTKEGKQLPYFRYGTHGDCRDHVTTTFPPDLGWFWEIAVRPLTGPDGERTGGLMLATGISQSASILGYGTEYLAFLRAFAWIAAEADPAAKISTLYLAL